MKKLISILVLACSLANLSAQSVYDMKKEDMITIINGTDSILVPVVIFELYGGACLQAYYNGSIEIEKKNNYSFSKWGFEVQRIEQTRLLVRRDRMIVEEFVVRTRYDGSSLCVLLYIFVCISGFLYLRNTQSTLFFIMFMSSIILCGYFIYYYIWFGLALYIGLFFVGAGIGYLSKKIEIRTVK